MNLAYLFGGFPPKVFFWFLDILITVFILSLTLGIRARWSSLGLFVVYFVGTSFAYSIGKIDHKLLPWFILLPLAFSNWGTQLAVSPDKPLKFNRFAFSFIALCVCFEMWSAGAEKALRWVGFDTSTSGVMSWFLLGFHVLDRDLLLTGLMFKFPPVILEAMDYGAVAVEVTGFFLLLWGRTPWRVWLIFLGILHLGNVLFLNISFHVHLIVYLPFLWYPIHSDRWLGGKFKRFDLSSCKPVFVVACILASIHIVTRIVGVGGTCLFMPNRILEQLAEIYVSSIIWPIFIVYGISRLDFSRRSSGLT